MKSSLFKTKNHHENLKHNSQTTKITIVKKSLNQPE